MSQLQTKSLILRPFEEHDANAMYKNWTHDERVAKYCRWHPHQDISATKALLDIYLAEYTKGFEYRWAITQKENDEPIGAIDVVDITDNGKTAEVGYVLSYEYWNKGYMSEVLNIIINELFQCGFTKITARHHIQNIASGKVMQKCGMKYTHNDKAQEKFGSDQLCDVKYYEVIKT